MTSLTYGSVCSGIEAATVAWEPLGMRAEWFSEIEPFPCSVLKHHYPKVPNLGDMRYITRQVLTRLVAAPDVLVGGTPCQAFSVAGLREGLDDDRGQLTMTYFRLLDAIDFIRGRDGRDPCIAVWENVPGVLSSKDNAFGCFLAGLAGEDVELKPAGKKWTNAGCVFGPKRAVAWRVMDAQYFGVAQRRRRVFVVASARKGFDPSAVLFEFDGVRRDSAPRRDAGQDAAGTLASRTDGGGFPGTDEACSGYVQPVGATLLAKPNCSFDHTLETYVAETLTTSNNRHVDNRTTLVTQHASSGEVSHCLNAGGMGRQDFETETLITQAYAFQPRIARNGRGDMGDVVNALTAQAGETGKGDAAPCVATIGFNARQDPDAWIERTGPLDTQGHTQAIAFSCKDYGNDAAVEISPTMRAMNHTGSHANAGGQLAVCVTGEITHTLKAEGFDASEDGTGRGQPITAAGEMAVRRLLPIECERLQGFPDGYTRVPVRKVTAANQAAARANPGDEFVDMDGVMWSFAADGPRYKALGNSMAVPCMRLIGARILKYLAGDMPRGFL